MAGQQPHSPNYQPGDSASHESAHGHVTGTANYVDDMALPANTLHVATGSVTLPAGVIQALNLTAVRTAAGVVDVITAQDIPGDTDIGPVFPGDVLLADQTIEYSGQPLFAVAATSLRAAQQAVRLAQIDVAATTPILDVDTALAEQAFVLPSRTWERGEKATNQHQLTGSLYVRGQEHFYLEGQVAVALPDERGGMVLHSSTQHPDDVQKLVARVLGLAMHKVRVTSRRMGGAFGGKESQAAPLACMAALFANRLQRPVKYRMPRHDDMLQTGKRHDFGSNYQLEFSSDGVLSSADITLNAKCGYSPDLSDGIVERAMFHANNGYFFPHARITGNRCKTNTVSNTAFRGFGGPQGMLIIEAAMDELAEHCGLEPLEARKRNLLRPGANTTPYGQAVDHYVLGDLLNALETRCDYQARQQAISAYNTTSVWNKKGLALTPVQFGISFTATHLNQAGALLQVYRDGSIDINHAGTEMGQGLHTKIRQIVASAFGVSADRVLHSATQSDKVPNASPTAASSGSDMNGMAALAACDIIKARLAEFARNALDWPDQPLLFADNSVTCGDHSASFNDLVQQAYMGRVSLSTTGFYSTPDIHFDKEKGHGNPFYYFAYGAAATEVIIDVHTGEYRIERVDILQDVGNSLNPAIDLGQIEGAYVQGLGWLTTEELSWNDDGQITSNGPANYKIPTALDCPPVFNVNFFEQANPQPTVHRSKAVGEPPLMLAISAWCALRQACKAAGNHLPALAVPATPEAVLNAVQAAQR